MGIMFNHYGPQTRAVYNLNTATIILAGITVGDFITMTYVCDTMTIDLNDGSDPIVLSGTYDGPPEDGGGYHLSFLSQDGSGENTISITSHAPWSITIGIYTPYATPSAPTYRYGEKIREIHLGLHGCVYPNTGLSGSYAAPVMTYSNVRSVSVSNKNGLVLLCDGALYEPYGAGKRLIAAPNTLTSHTIESDTLAIRPGAINSALIEEIIIPDSVTYLWKGSPCIRLTNVNAHMAYPLALNAGGTPSSYAEVYSYTIVVPDGTTSVSLNNVKSECQKLSIASSVASIGSLCFTLTEPEEVIFNQPLGMTVTLPTAGSTSGMFYNKTARTMTIRTDNVTIKNYAWATDGVTATITHIDGSAW